jgi:hypothetical protein
MNTTTRTRFVTAAVGAAIAGMAAPALLFLGAGTAHAAPDISEQSSTAATTKVQRAPGHVSIKTVPPLVSPPLVWGAFDSPAPIVGD